MSKNLNRSGLVPLETLNGIIDNIKAGECVVIPVDTCYIFAVDALNEKAVRKLYDIKKRPLNKPFHVCVATMAQVRELARVGPVAERLFRKFTPGPITVVMEKRKIIPDILVSGSNTIGVRIPDSPCALQLCAETGIPITATSANYSGKPVLNDIDSIIRNFGDSISDCIAGNGFLYDRTSTIVKAVDENIKILRQGAIDKKAIVKDPD